MPRNASGVMTVVNDDFVSGTTISSSEIDANFADIATEITGSLPVNGVKAMAANLPMGTNKITGLGDATLRTDALAAKQAQDGEGDFYPTVGGTADVITLAGGVATLTAYATGMKVRFIATGTNTTTVTVNVDSVGAKTIKDQDGNNLAAGIIATGYTVDLTYDGTNFVLGSVVLVADGSVTTGKIVDSAVTTAKINDNAVTLAKLEDGTQGDILYYGSSGAPTRLGAGTDGQVLQTQGTGANPQWATPAVAKLDEQTASLSANLSFDLPAGYSHFELRGWVAPATDAVHLTFQVSQSSTYVTSSSYAWAGGLDVSVGNNGSFSGSGTAAQITGGGTGTNIWGGSTNEQGAFVLRIYNPLDGTAQKHFSAETSIVNDNSAIVSGRSASRFTANTNAIDGIRIQFSSGNIASGKVALYGFT